MTIGIYGGSFDPIHSGHAMVANFVAQCNLVDQVWLMVSKRNPLKDHPANADDSDRLEMARIVASGCRNVEVSDFELGMPSPSYTVDTLRALKIKYPENDFRLVIGADSLADFDRWKEHEAIVREFGLIVYPRPGYKLPASEGPNMTILSGAPEFSMSSTLIREYVRDGWNVNYFVPLQVASYIRSHNLYAGSQL